MDAERAKEKILKYCAYQERSQMEVKNKLYGFGISTAVVNDLLLFLIQENYLNEERFAKHFAASKMRQKKWGARKIEIELKKKGVSKKLIDWSTQSLNKDQYFKNLVALIEKKDKTLTYKTEYERKQKLIRYLMGKGYAWSDIEEKVNDFLS